MDWYLAPAKEPLAESSGIVVPSNMSGDSQKHTTSRQKVAEHRKRMRESGWMFFETALPAELVSEVDRIKLERRASSRSAIIEAAIRSYIETEKQRA